MANRVSGTCERRAGDYNLSGQVPRTPEFLLSYYGESDSCQYICTRLSQHNMHSLKKNVNLKRIKCDVCVCASVCLSVLERERRRKRESEKDKCNFQWRA